MLYDGGFIPILQNPEPNNSIIENTCLVIPYVLVSACVSWWLGLRMNGLICLWSLNVPWTLTYLRTFSIHPQSTHIPLFMCGLPKSSKWSPLCQTHAILFSDSFRKLLNRKFEKATSTFGLFFCFFQNYMVLFWSSLKDVYVTLLEHDSPCLTVFHLPGMVPHFCTWWQLLEIYGRQWFFSVDSMMSISRWEEPYWISRGSNAHSLPSSQIVMK